MSANYKLDDISTEYEDIRAALGEISEYFEKCMNNAQPGRNAHRQFERWMNAVDWAGALLVEDAEK